MVVVVPFGSGEGGRLGPTVGFIGALVGFVGFVVVFAWATAPPSRLLFVGGRHGRTECSVGGFLGVPQFWQR